MRAWSGEVVPCQIQQETKYNISRPRPRAAGPGRHQKPMWSADIKISSGHVSLRIDEVGKKEYACGLRMLRPPVDSISLKNSPIIFKVDFTCLMSYQNGNLVLHEDNRKKPIAKILGAAR